jgi:hypothetical protein
MSISPLEHELLALLGASPRLTLKWEEIPRHLMPFVPGLDRAGLVGATAFDVMLLAGGQAALAAQAYEQAAGASGAGGRTHPAEQPGASTLPADPEQSDWPPVSDSDEKVLLYLLEQHPRLRHQADIAAGTGLSSRTVGDCLKRLRGGGLTGRPEGERKGEGLTEKGMQLAAGLRERQGG